MKNFIFITPETLTYQPNTDSPDPDFENLQIPGFGPGQTVEEAIKDILELDDNFEEKRPGRTFRLDLRNDNRRFFNLKDYRAKTRIAS